MNFIKLGALSLAVTLTLTACGGNSGGQSSGAAPAPAPEVSSEAEPAPAADSGETYTLKFAHVVRPTTPKGMAIDEFKKVVEEKSGGRIIVDVYPDSQMGTDQEITEQMMLGTLHMNAPFTSVLTSVIEEFEVFDLPYLFKTEEQAFEALNGGELGAKFDQYLADKGFVSLGYWTGGFKQITNSIRPIESVADLSGVKIRVSQSPLLVSQFRAINAGGISVPFSELYTALQTGTVDGQENPLSNIATRKFYEVQDYMTMSDHGLMLYVFIMSADMYNQLPSDLQEIVREAAAEIIPYQWELNRDKDSEYYQEIEDSGITISVFTPEAKEGFREATSNVYSEFEQKANGKELLEIVAKYNQ